jgi:hypothetical protein
MDEHEFDALFQRPFGTEDAKNEDARWRRCATLGTVLFGRNSGDLQRQLLASHPEIPSGYDVADFRDLLQHLEMVSDAMSNPRKTWLSPLAFVASATLSVGSRRFTFWEARCEIVRRAIEYLEGR